MSDSQSKWMGFTENESSSWHIVSDAPLRARPTDDADGPAEGEPIAAPDNHHHNGNHHHDQIGEGRVSARTRPRQPSDAGRLWAELDALMLLPQPPVAPANTVFNERYLRGARRRALWRRVRRLAVAAAFGALLGAVVWLWAPLGWSHPVSQPVALPHLGLVRPSNASMV
ncbi:MAG TPA: hypothetical protein VGR57_06535 [Ktedonobacterales bacterium]|nr:hypothetical protein [Ktedonobacterales bacterium]